MTATFTVPARSDRGGPPGYGSVDVVRRVNLRGGKLTFRQLDYWRRLHAIVPVVDADGSGSRAVWSARDIDRLVAIARVSKAMKSTFACDMTAELVRALWDGLEHDDTVTVADHGGLVRVAVTLDTVEDEVA